MCNNSRYRYLYNYIIDPFKEQNFSNSPVVR